MKEETYFHIPQPCHENWDNMTPEGKGRFCGSCSKQVVDFSLMSDQQVLNYFSSAESKVCGRFANDQLQRAFTPIKEQKKKTWWIAAMMPLLLVFDKKADKGNGTNGHVITADTTEPSSAFIGLILPEIKGQIIDTVVTEDTGITLGAIAIIQPDFIDSTKAEAVSEIIPDTSFIVGDVEIKNENKKTIGDTIITQNKLIVKGSVTDEKGNAVPYASIRELKSLSNTTTDSMGNFELVLRNIVHDKITIEASSIGYERNIIEVSSDSGKSISLILKQKEALLPNVTVTTGDYFMGSTAGGICIVRKVTYYDMLDTSWRKVFHNEAFKIFPNPVQKGASVKLEVKKAGTYSIQFLDNSPKLILAKDFTAMSDKAIMEITIPSSLAAGMYYIRVMDEKNKKQYTDKLIVQ